jgi:hypothetical protein
MIKFDRPYALFICIMHATCTAYSIDLYVVTSIIGLFGESANYETPHRVDFSSFLL